MWRARYEGRGRRRREPAVASASGQPARRCEGLGRDERGLQRVERRSIGAENRVGERHRLVEGPATEGQSGAQNPHRPFVPAAGLPPVGAVRLAGTTEELAGDVVLAANQVNLRQSVEDGARGFVKLDRAADVEGPMQRERRLGVRSPSRTQICPSVASATARPWPDPCASCSDDAAFGQRRAPLVTMLEHHDVGLVAARRRQHVVGVHQGGEALGLPERRHRFVEPPDLRERDAQRANAPARDGGDRRPREAPTRPS